MRAVALLVLLGVAAACGGGSGGSERAIPIDPGGIPVECDESRTFASTFDGIQEVIFEGRGCTQAVCHGASAQGGLDLRRDAAYASLVGAPSTASALPRVLPGDQKRSFLWQKLAAATEPGSVQVAGSPMPSGLPPLSERELEIVRLWIYAGASETAAVLGTEELLDGCLPDPEPITITPLEPPPPGEGVQLVMPGWLLPAGSEHELCFASYYDLTDQVPDEFKDPTGRFFYLDRMELRQDPQSHHLILNYAFVSPDELGHPSFGSWSCVGGERAGDACEPTDLAFCGGGTCASEPKRTFACIDFGPRTGGPGVSFEPIGGAQEAQALFELYEGVYQTMPLKGVLYWNPHAFNLTSRDHVMNGRINYFFAKDRVYPAQGIFNIDAIFSPSAAPFSTQVVCNDHVLPQGARLYSLSSHTHKRGKHFWVDLSDGTRLYENFVYNDPSDRWFDPPLAFDSPDARERTLHYCALYNNGVADDGSHDPESVARRSRTPQSALQPCEPEACATGRVGAPCAGVGDDATCDSSPGTGDGWCDACPITGGESTENEMFILIGEYFVP